MILIGSGNLTSCGHGKNHEVWNSIYLTSKDDPKIKLLYQIWNYLTYLHNQLEGIAKKKFELLKNHCSLLNDIPKQIDLREIKIDDGDLHIQLMTNDKIGRAHV